VALVEKVGEIDVQATERALERLRVDRAGLDEMDRRYLKTIGEKFDGGPVGVETLAAALSEERVTIEDIIEPYLMQEGYVQRTPRGRVITRAGCECIGLKYKKGQRERQSQLPLEGISNGD
jgi:Holliday junction DNA helicase RuvB